MFVRVTDDGEPTLEELEDCTRFHVEASSAEPAVLGPRLGAAGTVEGAAPDHAWIEVSWVRAQAASRVPGSWIEDFQKMLGYAASKGWMDADGGAISAHVEVH